MQGDTLTNKPDITADNTFFLYCKPQFTKAKTISDSLSDHYDSLQYKYFFNYAIKYNNSANQDVNHISTRSSFLSPHLLQIKNNNSQILKTYSNDWILVILIICFSLFSWTFYNSSKRFKQILHAAFTNRAINQLSRDGDLLKEKISVSLIAIYLISITLFIYQIGHYFVNFKALGFYNIISFLKLLFIISLLTLAKWLITKFIGFLFKNTSASNGYLLNSLIFNINTGIILLLIDILIFYAETVYTNSLIIFGLLLLLIINTIRYFRYIIIGISYSKFSQFYLFLYLCTLEILPLLILLKVSIGLINNYL